MRVLDKGRSVSKLMRLNVKKCESNHTRSRRNKIILKEIKEELMKELKYLEEIKEKVVKIKKPRDYGRIEITQRGNNMYYTRVNATGKKYVPKSNEKYLCDNMQYSYNRDVVCLLNSKIVALKKFIDAYDSRRIEEIYSNLHPGRKPYVTPIVESDDAYLERWLKNAEMTMEKIKNSYPITSDSYTNKGEHVRSKSEEIIADWLNLKNIPYKYELACQLKNGKILFPDFTLLDIKNRREIYWEHLGRMSEPAYAEKNIRKIEEYERNGLVPGKNLILTFETNQKILDSRLFKDIVQPYLE